MNFIVLHSIPDCAEGGQLAKSRERDGGRGENISVANIMVNSDRVRRWLGATMCRAAGLGRFTAPLATSRRWFCLPYTLVESGGLEPCRCSRPVRDTAPQSLPQSSAVTGWRPTLVLGDELTGTVSYCAVQLGGCLRE